MSPVTAGEGGSYVSETVPSSSQRSLREVRARKVLAAGLTAAAVLSAVVLRWFDLDRQSLYFDEGLTAWAASLSPADIVRFARSDDAPPLYFLLQHYWGALFGDSEYALRALCAFFGTLSLPVFYFLAKKVLKDSMAVTLAMWLFAFSIMQLWYSQEARFYEVLSFLALVGLYALILFLERRSALLFATIVLSVTASLYTHNMMFFYLLALNVVWLIYPGERALPQRVKEILLADVLVGFLYLPWVPSFLGQLISVHKSFWAPKPTVSALVHTSIMIAGFFPDYLMAVAVRLLPLSPDTAWVCVFTVVSLLCGALLAGGFWRVSKADRSKNIALLLYCFLPILAVYVLSRFTTPVYGDRIFTNSSVVIPIVLAYPLALQQERKWRILYGFLGIVLAVTTALSGFGYLRYQKKEDWRGAMTSLLKIPERNRLIVFVSRVGEPLFDYYAKRFPVMGSSFAKMGLPMNFVESFPPPQGREINTNDIARLKLVVESRKYSEVDLVLSHESQDDPHDLVSGYLNQAFILREEQRFYQVRIVRFLAPPH